MKISPPPPRSSAIGPLAKMSHAERSVICLHCQKVHNPGFIWSFCDTVRVCFTCYRVMGEDGRKSYERRAARAESKQPVSPTPGAKNPGSARNLIGLLVLLLLIVGAVAWFFDKPLTGQIAEQRVWTAESRLPANR